MKQKETKEQFYTRVSKQSIRGLTEEEHRLIGRRCAENGTGTWHEATRLSREKGNSVASCPCCNPNCDLR